MTVVTRFAPSPTGFLHIGGARTALFNKLFAKHHGGQYLLRIEDTDAKRSTQEAIDAIYDALSWLGLECDEEPVSQSARRDRHAEVAQQLLDSGHAYRCYASPEELTEMRAQQKAAGQPTRYDGRWRDRAPSEAPAGVDPVIRLRAPQDGETVLEDLVQGQVTVANAQLDDMILLRSDGSPTYMLSVVVDDYDMGITHVIRGDDHLTNAFRQIQIFKAMGWKTPIYGHVPLIHGPDGAKLSKRHGALGAEAYRDMGFLPEALRNYLLRLGWGHGDDEIISDEQAIAWFDGSGLGKAPARFDTAKLTALNTHYLKAADNGHLVSLITPGLEQNTGVPMDELASSRLLAGMESLKERAKTLVDLTESAALYVRGRPLVMEPKAAKILSDEPRVVLAAARNALSDLQPWTAEALENWAREYAESHHLKLGQLAQPLRAAVTGSNVSPPIFEVIAIFGRDETLSRIEDIAEST
ncbi:MAG: glutamate--tRNA ligase [Rhodospirillaceae bacterium]|nr:glutamate--tRNA ligase [Rhodospirillaceae bacterium]